MAHFRAVISGNRGEASRLGSKASGVRSSTDGWESGVDVRGHYNSETDSDEFGIWMTGGSNGQAPSKYLGFVKVVDGKPVWKDAE